MNSNTDSRLILTATERLARRLHHHARIHAIASGMKGWERPDITSLNTWMDRLWGESFQEQLPASKLARTRIWKELVETSTAPLPLAAGFSLYALLDETYEILVRHKIDPAAGPPSTPLVQWRRDLARSFRRRIECEGLFHPGEWPVYLMNRLKERRISLPRKVSLQGFEFPAPLERDLFQLMETITEVKYDVNRRSEGGVIHALALSSPEQELTYLGRSLIEDAGAMPLHRIGVIAPDLTRYAQTLARTLTDLMGHTPAGDAHWFNITLGSSLSKLPLFASALLPFRFIQEGERRELLLALILSPYYGLWQGKRHRIARADHIWRSKGIISGLDSLKSVLMGADEETHTLIFNERTKPVFAPTPLKMNCTQRMKAWIELLANMWQALDFPLISGEEDQLAWRHVQEILNGFSTHLADISITGYEFVRWFIHEADRKTTQREAAEDAGVQIMGLIESRGLDFDKVYLLDVNDRSLPQPARPLPLLDGEERRRIQGGTPQSQYDFARVVFERIVHSAPRIVLLRAEQEDSKPLTPSPFWPDESVQASLDIWTDPDPAWLRASWLRSAYEGRRISKTDAPICSIGIDPASISPLPMLSSLSLSPHLLKIALACPFRFLMEILLKVTPLETVTAAPSPRDRGTLLHRIFAAFTEQMRARGKGEDVAPDEEERCLVKILDDALSPFAGNPRWQIEKIRLIGSPRSSVPGVLNLWLQRERQRRQEGWHCIAEERTYSGLSIKGCPMPLSGRIDRIDFSAVDGLACYDYKTGKVPAISDILDRFTEPQLPVYLLALRAGKIPGLKDHAPSAEMISTAGYLQIKSANALRDIPIRGIETSLEKWCSVIADIAVRIAGGNFEPSPYPASSVENRNNVCQDCTFRTLCRRGLFPEWSIEEEEYDDAD